MKRLPRSGEIRAPRRRAAGRRAPFLATRRSKRCSKCLETKPRSKFYRNAGRADGLTPYCQPCHNEYVAQRRANAGQYVVGESVYQPPRIYRRRCNRCNKKYRGIGRLLCRVCRALAALYPNMAIGVSA